MEVLTARNSQQAWQVQDKKDGQPHGWIQWKGSDVCMDVYCKCGAHLHVDASFAYHVECGHCGAVYFCNGHIELIEITERPGGCVIKAL